MASARARANTAEVASGSNIPLALTIVAIRVEIDAGRALAAHVIVRASRIDRMKRRFPAIQSIFDERQERSVLVVGRRKERADVTLLADKRAPQVNRAARAFQAFLDNELLIHVRHLEG